MTPRDRVHAAMRHEPTDRVPVMCQLALGHYFRNSPRDPVEIWFDSEVFAETLVEFQKRYRFDGVLLNLPGRPPDWRDAVVHREPIEGGQRLIWKGGVETIMPADDNPQAFLEGGAGLPRASIDGIDPDDAEIYRLPGLIWNTWHAPSLWNVPQDAALSDPDSYPDWLVAGLRHARAIAPDASVHAEVFSPFTFLMELFGYENALIALIDAPETCEILLDRFTGQAAALATRYARCDPDAILVSSAFAGGGFISREMYRRFVVPFERRLVEVIRAAGHVVYVHTCGAIGDRLDLMAEVGYDGVDTLDPPPLGNVDLARAKADFGDRFFFKGNLDAVNEMLLADDAAFERAVRQRLEIGSAGSGYILSSACSVAPHVDPCRLSRLVEIAEAFRG